MRFNRRKFLVFGGLSGLGLVVAIGKTLIGQAGNSPGLPPIASHTPLANTSQDLVLRFVAIGDNGSGNEHQYAVAQAMTQYHRQHPYHLVVMAGDNIYDHGEIAKLKAVFEDPYQPLLKQQVRFQACLGNHDIREANGDGQVKTPLFNMKGRYYTFREKSVQFFVLDTNTNVDWPVQLAWLTQALTQSDAPWKIVYGHHPIYASGHYGTDQAMVQRLTPLFKKHRVQLYINGHEHHYERTKLLDGTTYLITGHGGAYLRPVQPSAVSAYAVSRYGFSALAVYADRIEIQGVGTDGQVFDRGIVPI
jgi:Calcineurin-like phosphoesterase